MSILAFFLISVFILKLLSKRQRMVHATTQPRQRRLVGKYSYHDDRGYLRFRDSEKLVHRHIAEKKLGRGLRTEEVVHHIDGNKLNNSATNLEVVSSWAEHDAIHRRNQLVYGTWHKAQN